MKISWHLSIIFRDKSRQTKYTMMKVVMTILASMLACVVMAQHEHASTAADTLKKSIPKEVHAQVGQAHLMLYYHAPAVRGRMIWGGLVPYGEVWVTGAHRATAWEFNRDIVIGNTTIAAGKYAIFTIPGKEQWTIIINRNWNQHLADDYDAKEDVVRINVTPQNIAALQERLAYGIKAQSDHQGILTIRWEKILISLPFTIKP
jgi:hypothetical protein